MSYLTKRLPLVSASTLASVAGLALVAASAQGAMITWTNTAANNKFDDKLNWNPNAAVPGAADEAVIALPLAAPTISAANVTLDKLTLNGLASTSLVVDGKDLSTKTTSAITKGELRLFAKGGGNVKFTAETNGITVGAGGIIIMDAPATAGDVTIRLPAIANKFNVLANGELRVKPGAGGNRTIDGDFNNAGKLTVDKSLTIKYTTVAGPAGDVTVKNTGTASVAANQFLNILGTDLDVSEFTMAGGKITNAGNISLEKLTFNYNGGAIRNGPDSDRGGVNLKAGVWNLNIATALFLQINDTGSIAGTGIKGPQQEVFWNAAGNATPSMSFAVATTGVAPNDLKIFENKGKMTFATGGSLMTFSGLGVKNVVLNSGTMQLTGNGAVLFDETRFTNSPAGTVDISADMRLKMAAGEPAAEVPINAGKMNFSRVGATLDTGGKLLQNFSAASKGTFSVGKGITANIQTGGKGVKGGNIIPQKGPITVDPPAPLGAADSVAFTITEEARGGSGLSFGQASLTIDGGWEQEPDSVLETAIEGLSLSTFSVGTIECLNGPLMLGGTMNLFLGGVEPAPGTRFTIARADSPVIGVFDFGGGVSDTIYPIGGSGTLKFTVLYNDVSNPDGPFNVTLVTGSVPTPGTITLLALAALSASTRRRHA